jgi:hypothetical protein
VSFLDSLIETVHAKGVLARDRGTRKRLTKAEREAKRVKRVGAGRRVHKRMPLEPLRERLDRLYPNRRYRGRRTDADELKRQQGQATVDGMYQHYVRACRTRRRKAEAKGNAEWARVWEFGISRDEWRELWMSCDRVERVVGSGLSTRVELVEAWRARGPSQKTDVTMQRVDKTKPWTISNVCVMYRGKVISHL